MEVSVDVWNQSNCAFLAMYYESLFLRNFGLYNHSLVLLNQNAVAVSMALEIDVCVAVEDDAKGDVILLLIHGSSQIRADYGWYFGLVLTSDAQIPYPIYIKP